MSWRDTVMTQTELYDKLDEVTAERDALASRLDVASTLVAEIVAYFDVLDNPMSQVPEWPRDWLKRAKAFPVEKHRPLSDPPCRQCGYNGPGYYQLAMHPCAANQQSE